MSEIVDKAPPAAPIALTDTTTALFMKQDSKTIAAAVTLPGSGNFNLALFDVTAIGYAKPTVPGTLTVTIYGKPSAEPTTDLEAWLPIASAAEPIGGEGDLPQAVFMLKLEDLLANASTGKMQGTFKSNVASNPIAAADIEQHPRDVGNTDPLYVFAVGASFAAEAPPETGRATPRAEPEPQCTVILTSLTLSA